MAKSNRATRKELEAVVQKIIEELNHTKQAIMAIDSYLGAYVKFKGDTITFNDFIRKEIEKKQNKTETKTQEPMEKYIKRAKESIYNRIKTPPL